MESPEQFLHRSFRLLDSGDYRGWLGLCTPDISYVVTTRLASERKYLAALVDDDFVGLDRRLQLMERLWHAEEPPTQTLHMLTNVETAAAGEGVEVHACFLVVASRRERQIALYGRYHDVLRLVNGDWQIAARTATLEKNLLDTGNITFIV
jgi:3-phenylpropionate/cinnamic acid dioxygenase small subunit